MTTNWPYWPSNMQDDKLNNLTSTHNANINLNVTPRPKWSKNTTQIQWKLLNILVLMLLSPCILLYSSYSYHALAITHMKPFRIHSHTHTHPTPWHTSSINRIKFLFCFVWEKTHAVRILSLNIKYPPLVINFFSMHNHPPSTSH